MITYEPFRAYVASRNIKKKDIMKRTGISAASMSKLKNDKYVSLEIINRICQDLKCKVEDLILFKP